MKHFFAALGGLYAGSFVAAHADALPSVLSAEPMEAFRSPWVLQITPYMWAAGIKGDISPFRQAPTIAIKKPFSQIMNELNFGGFVDIWGRYEQLVLSSDIMYVNTMDSRAIGSLPGLGQTPGLGVSVDTKQFTATIKAGYRVYDAPAFTVDLLAGVRFWRISNEVSVKYAALSPSYGERFGWADPVVGARAFYQITDKLSVHAQADVGGFSVGSERTWQGLATVNYTFTKNLSASAGYKLLHVKYHSDGYVFDTTLKGPVLGLTWRF